MKPLSVVDALVILGDTSIPNIERISGKAALATWEKYSFEERQGKYNETIKAMPEQTAEEIKAEKVKAEEYEKALAVTRKLTNRLLYKAKVQAAEATMKANASDYENFKKSEACKVLGDYFKNNQPKSRVNSFEGKLASEVQREEQFNKALAVLNMTEKNFAAENVGELIIQAHTKLIAENSGDPQQIAALNAAKEILVGQLARDVLCLEWNDNTVNKGSQLDNNWACKLGAAHGVLFMAGKPDPDLRKNKHIISLYFSDAYATRGNPPLKCRGWGLDSNGNQLGEHNIKLALDPIFSQAIEKKVRSSQADPRIPLNLTMEEMNALMKVLPDSVRAPFQRSGQQIIPRDEAVYSFLKAEASQHSLQNTQKMTRSASDHFKPTTPPLTPPADIQQTETPQLR